MYRSKCNLIGVDLKGLGDKFSCKGSQMFNDIFAKFEISHFQVKTAVAIFGQSLENLGQFCAWCVYEFKHGIKGWTQCDQIGLLLKGLEDNLLQY